MMEMRGESRFIALRLRRETDGAPVAQLNLAGASGHGALPLPHKGVYALMGEGEKKGASRVHHAIFVLMALLAALPALAADIPLSERKSGYDFMGRETRAMQDDDTVNPGMLWVLDGEVLWNRAEGSANRSCADCHGDARTSMAGVAARYPAYDAARGQFVDLEARINLSRTEHQQAAALPFESKALLALSAYIGRQSRGLPIELADDARTRAAIEAGRKSFTLRQGQLNLSCAQCHDDNWGGKLGAAPIPQAHPNGYPMYRLEWQNLGSLQRRLRNCLSGMRAENYAYGAPELVELELYLMWRARGLPMETPAVRP
jgi:L-cysteine S-thiosulfotransferase